MSEIKVLAGLESESSLKNGSGAAASETGLGTEGRFHLRGLATGC